MLLWRRIGSPWAFKLCFIVAFIVRNRIRKSSFSWGRRNADIRSFPDSLKSSSATPSDQVGIEDALPYPMHLASSNQSRYASSVRSLGTLSSRSLFRAVVFTGDGRNGEAEEPSPTMVIPLWSLSATRSTLERVERGQPALSRARSNKSDLEALSRFPRSSSQVE